MAHAIRFALLVVLLAAPGCDKLQKILGEGEAGGGGGGGSGSGGGGGGLFGAKGSGPKCPSKSRVEVGAAQSVEALQKSETWTPDHTYVVYGEFDIGGNTLTVEAGTTICFENDPRSPGSPKRGRFVVGQGGRLRMMGAPDRRITITHMRGGRETSEPFYLRSAYGELTMHHVDVHDAGSQQSPALEMYPDKGPALDMRDVTFHLIKGKGLRVINRNGFTPQSSVTVVASAATGETEFPILEIDPMSAGTLSRSVFKVGDKVAKSMRYIQISVREVGNSVTWRSLGVPYRVYRLGQEIATDVPGRPAVLTIEAGNTIEMPEQANIFVGGRGTREAVGGDLVAAGTADAPITFTSAKRAKAPGDWGAIMFRGGAFDPRVSKLEHVKVEYGGLTGGNTIFHCSDNRNDTGTMVGIEKPMDTGAYSGPVIRASTFANSSGNAIRFYCQTPPSRDCIRQDYTKAELGNTFTATGAASVPGACR